MTTLHLPVYASPEDRLSIHKMLDAILVDGNTVSIHDGEEWCLKLSTNRDQILHDMASTGQDTIKVRAADGSVLGIFFMIYANSEETPIADHSVNDYCEHIFSIACR